MCIIQCMHIVAIVIHTCAYIHKFTYIVCMKGSGFVVIHNTKYGKVEKYFRKLASEIAV